jgi:hypothetical protein
MDRAFPWSRFIFLATVLVSGPLLVAQSDVDASYNERVERLGDKDIDGHYRLAEWCRQQGRYDLVHREARKVLSLDPKHENAALLLKLADRKLKETRARAPASRPAASTEISLLTDADIQRLRWAELQARGFGRVERVRVEFAKGFVERFVKDLVNDAARDRFRARPAGRFQMVIEASKGVDGAREQYADQIRILDDPRVFSEFRRAVLPDVMKGCGTSACHGGSAAGSFRLVNERGRPAQSLYTNFYILQSAVGKGGQPVIDRERPDKSLLLQYLLPASEAQVSHPVVQGPVRPVFRSREDRGYQAIREWIVSLHYPRPSYGIRFEGAEPPTTSRAATGGGEGGRAPPRRARSGGGE